MEKEKKEAYMGKSEENKKVIGNIPCFLSSFDSVRPFKERKGTNV